MCWEACMAGGEGRRGSSGKAFVVAGMVVAAPLLTVVVVLLCLVILVVAILQSDYGLGTRCVTGSSSWVDWAVSVAKDDKHGYSQPNRGGDPDYDCSSFVWAALRHAGFDVGSSPFNTDGMDSVLKAAGFERSDFRDVASLQAGDVVWADGHTEIYMGDGEFVGAHWDERHGVEGRTPGDQTGDEIGVTSTLNARYTRVYRAPASQGSQAVSGGTSDSGWDGMGAEQAKASWFGGLAGPGNTCVCFSKLASAL
ncbi:peptidoglycan amidohydrolase family protein [Bifidobacterium longum]|uniref:peptidoglycan amidohydrolase family protein n=1 Tax=Bifidobacterium longum TaxID=216816 RepID=UPI00398D0E3D